MLATVARRLRTSNGLVRYAWTPVSSSRRTRRGSRRRSGSRIGMSRVPGSSRRIRKSCVADVGQVPVEQDQVRADGRGRGRGRRRPCMAETKSTPGRRSSTLSTSRRFDERCLRCRGPSPAAPARSTARLSRARPALRHRRASATGSSTEKRAPDADRALDATVPPIASTRRCESASPRPVPSTPPASAPRRSNGTKRRASLSAGDPRPGVGHGEPDAVGRRAIARDAVTAPPATVVLDRVREEVQEHLLEPLPVGEDVQIIVHRLDRRPSTWAWAGRADQLDGVPHRLGDRHRLQGQPGGAPLDAADVEHLVDQREQVVPGGQDLVDALVLVRRVSRPARGAGRSRGWR